uniref:Tetraspanin-10 n=1 Tax=Gouania willdenowi TaxID=441366 RepID=A0A8C5DLV8_GOUWI
MLALKNQNHLFFYANRLTSVEFCYCVMCPFIIKESFAQEKISSIGTDPMLIVMSLGFVLTMLCLSGCVGALRENCFLLKLFSFAVLTLIAVQVLLGILAYSMQGQIGGYLRSGMLAAMVRYQDDLDLRFITDEIQTNLQCCGADNYRDWEVNIYYNCSAPGVLACGVPATCCVDPLENGTVWNSQCGVGALMLDEFSICVIHVDEIGRIPIHIKIGSFFLLCLAMLVHTVQCVDILRIRLPVRRNSTRHLPSVFNEAFRSCDHLSARFQEEKRCWTFVKFSPEIALY